MFDCGSIAFEIPRRGADKYFDVLQIVREEAKTGKKAYDLMDRPAEITIFDENGKKVDMINRFTISNKVERIFEKIKLNIQGKQKF